MALARQLRAACDPSTVWVRKNVIPCEAARRHRSLAHEH
jgi:hypothetical protein